jgi:hypothetical protein
VDEDDDRQHEQKRDDEADHEISQQAELLHEIPTHHRSSKLRRPRRVNDL